MFNSSTVETPKEKKIVKAAFGVHYDLQKKALTALTDLAQKLAEEDEVIAKMRTEVDKLKDFDKDLDKLRLLTNADQANDDPMDYVTRIAELRLAAKNWVERTRNEEHWTWYGKFTKDCFEAACEVMTHFLRQ